MKKTLIIGASTDPDRYAYKAAHMLTSRGHQIVNIGIKKGEVAGVAIEKPDAIYHDIDTITLYIGPATQPQYFDYIVATKPKRVVFNPGTENEALEELLDKHQIAYTEACTLVLLSTGQY
ncbi:CoA-binding protein [Pedobacter chitinilyticus]|uniref:CoA-binding protein n=1 Tax=Pedobacter chitinilyticus TaxID=2233776 RepID=A0A443YPN0_9SPHI|nr:CoA-binding protein [Pedobacter chitinilyticus]RWU05759.1 CoA-binding protein [Pedobacter chitinilyticus]